MTQRLANALEEDTVGDLPPGRDDSRGGVRSPEVDALLKSCGEMASRLAELDPMHAQFYEFVKQGGSVWGLGQALPVRQGRRVGAEG